MEATQNYPNLLSEKEAAKRLGIARITLLRAREAGRIRFFRIGTRVLYSEAQLIEFLNACEKNKRVEAAGQSQLEATRRKENQVSRSPCSISAHNSKREASTAAGEADQTLLPFTAVR